MKSPFPGMDPWLEDHWRDVHHSFLTYARDDVQPQLPGPLSAPLPTIKIPLREDDEDVRLDVQSLIDRCYRNGRYDDIDYVHTKPPGPPLIPDEADFTKSVLANRTASFPRPFSTDSSSRVSLACVASLAF